MISKEEYQKAVDAKKAAEETISAYFKEKREAFDRRLIENPIFTEDELTFSAIARCPCGYGLAYPKDCGAGHYWDCAGILLGKASQDVTHTDKLPFSFYDVKSESEYRGTTRGTVFPRSE